MNPRPQFDEAVQTLKGFLRSQGHSDQLLWLSRDRITGFRNHFWIYRPDELHSDQASRDYYETIRPTPTSIRVDVLGEVDSHSLAYVQDWGGDGSHLNFGITTSPWKITPVSNPILWLWLRFYTALRGISPFLKHTQITQTKTGQGGATKPLPPTDPEAD